MKSPIPTTKKVKFKVKIISCLSNLEWYYNKIGKVYEITLEGTYHYYFRDKAKCLRPILKDNCKKLKA